MTLMIDIHKAYKNDFKNALKLKKKKQKLCQLPIEVVRIPAHHFPNWLKMFKLFFSISCTNCIFLKDLFVD